MDHRTPISRRAALWATMGLFCAAAGLATAPLARASEDVPRETRGGQLTALRPDGSPGAVCPLEHTDFEVEVAGFVARVRVTQTFRNPTAEPIEAIYTFPLSQRGAVDAMWMRTGGREIRGQIQRREEARRIYEQARDAGQLASLLDQERPNIFTQSVANLMPGAEVEIEIQYVETLDFEAGRFELILPTVVGPRFNPGAPAGRSGSGREPGTSRVPDASRITPPITAEGSRAGHDLSVSVDLDAGVPILRLEAPLHEIDVEHRDGKSTARVRLRRRDEIPNRDFVLRWEVSGDEIESGVLVHRMPGEDGTVSIVILPPKRVSAARAAPKELVFVIDRSGSQRGLPLAKAKETMLWMLDRMNPNDTFQVIDFGSTANALFDRPRLASAGMKARARRTIEALQANGGTMMAEAIRRVASVPADDNRLRIVSFMTDGYIGNDFEILDLVKSLRSTSRWFPFGTGNSVNRFLIEQMAAVGGGEAEFVLLGEPGEAVARRFHERIASPVLTDVRLAFEGVDVRDVYPRDVSDVWADRPLIVHARYSEAGSGRVVLTGFQQGRPYRQVIDVRLPRVARKHDAMTSIWARARVDDLLRRDYAGLQRGHFPENLKQEIVQIALAHRLVTQFTSFVAVEERVVNQGGRQQTVTVPVEMPQGVTYEGIFGAASDQVMRGRSASPFASIVGMSSGALRARPSASSRAQNPRQARGRVLAETEDRLMASTGKVEDSIPEKLTAPLRALLAGRVTPAGLDLDGDRVHVKVWLLDASDAVVRALEKAGLRIDLRLRREVIGWIAIDALTKLAEVEGVDRIEPDTVLTGS